MNYWIKGNDAYLINNTIDQIITNEFSDDVEIIKIDNLSEKLSLQMILDDLTTISLFTQRKLVIVYNPLFLMRAKKEDSDTQRNLELLEKYYLHCDYAYSLMFVLTETIDTRLAVVKQFLKLIQGNSKCIQLPSLTDPNEKIGFVTSYLKKHDIELDKSLMNMLMERLSNDGYGILNQLDQLVVYPSTLNKDVIDRLIAKPLENEVFALTNALNANDTSRALKIVKDLLIQNNQPIALIALLASNYRVLYQVKTLTQQGLDDATIASILQMNPKRLYFIHKSIANKSSQQLGKVLSIFATLDQQIKNGEIDAVYGLELALLKCKGV